MGAVLGRPVYARRKRVLLTCCVCGQVYEQHAYRAATSRYCSKQCWAHRKPQVTCRGCGKEFVPREQNGIYCSRDCCFAYRVGPLAPRWKDGKSLERQRARDAPALTIWRHAVWERDGYRCCRCGIPSDLHAHHIKSYADYPELRTVVSNGETLCQTCHGLEHGKDFSRRRQKTCPDCGKRTTGRGEDGLCRSCAMRRSHGRRRSRQL